MTDSQRRNQRIHFAGMTAWVLGFLAVICNVWLMRSGSSEVALWIIGPLLVVVGDLLGSLFLDDIPEDALTFPFKTGSMIAVAAAIGGFLWLTLVMPTSSDTGQTAIVFFHALEEDDIDAAYGMLSAEAQQRIPRSEFVDRLPPQYRTQTGASVTAIRGSVGTVAGQSACVDGMLTVPDGSSPHFSVGLITDDEGVGRIDTLLIDDSCTFR